MSIQFIAMINKSNNIIPIIFEKRLEPGRYAIEIDEYTNELYLLERGTLKDDTYMYYCKTLQNYNGFEYLYTVDYFEERVKFNINSLLRNELKGRKRSCIK